MGGGDEVAGTDCGIYCWDRLLRGDAAGSTAGTVSARKEAYRLYEGHYEMEVTAHRPHPLDRNNTGIPTLDEELTGLV